jgi:hypothetical protein
VLGGDLAWQAGAQDLLRGQLLLSDTRVDFDAEDRPVTMQAESGHHLWLGWQRRNEGWNLNTRFEHIGPRFANDNGFAPQTGVRRLTALAQRRLGAQDLAFAQLYDLNLEFNAVQTEALSDPAHGVRRGELLERRLQPGFWLTAARNTEVWGYLGLDSLRARSGGVLHRPRTVGLGFAANPAPWLNYLGAELEWGRRLDVDADRLGRGAWLLVEAKLRGELPRGWWLEFEQRAEQGFVRDPAGNRAFSDLALQSLAVLHFSARDSLRLIGQSSRYQRRAEPLLDGLDERGRHLSLVFQHRQGLSRIFSLGLTRASTQPGHERQTELFAKAVFSYDARP